MYPPRQINTTQKTAFLHLLYFNHVGLINKCLLLHQSLPATLHLQGKVKTEPNPASGKQNTPASFFQASRIKDGLRLTAG